MLPSSISRQNKLPQIAVIAPDLATGKSFTQKMREQLTQFPDLVAHQLPAQVPPRIIGEELTEDVTAVSSALAMAVVDSVESGHSWLTIACNTLSLPLFVAPALEQARNILKNTDQRNKLSPSFTLLTTLDLLRRYAETRLVLATRPVSDELARAGILTFDTFVSERFSRLERETAKQLVQTIIWHTKKMHGSDIKTAPPEFQTFSRAENEVRLEVALVQLVELLKKLPAQRVILACTELPDSFAFLKRRRPDLTLPLLFDPADLVGQEFARWTTKHLHF